MVAQEKYEDVRLVDLVLESLREWLARKNVELLSRVVFRRLNQAAA